MSFDAPPRFAAWHHREARSGFEVVFLRSDDEGCHLESDTAAVEDGEVWAVHYAISVDRDWITRSAHVWGLAATGRHELSLESVGAGRWLVNGEPAPHLDGCPDIDLESSSVTNAFAVHHLGLEIGQHSAAPAAYVRALDLSVERLEQGDLRLDDDDDDGARQRDHYPSPAFDFECELSYDESGLVLDYPGIAVRAA